MTRREQQYKDSAQLTFYGFIGIAAIVIVMCMTGGSPKNTGEAVANPALEYTDEYQMWITGAGDTIWE